MMLSSFSPRWHHRQLHRSSRPLPLRRPPRAQPPPPPSPSPSPSPSSHVQAPRPVLELKDVLAAIQRASEACGEAPASGQCAVEWDIADEVYHAWCRQGQGQGQK